MFEQTDFWKSKGRKRYSRLQDVWCDRIFFGKGCFLESFSFLQVYLAGIRLACLLLTALIPCLAFQLFSFSLSCKFIWQESGWRAACSWPYLLPYSCQPNRHSLLKSCNNLHNLKEIKGQFDTMTILHNFLKMDNCVKTSCLVVPNCEWCQILQGPL